MLCSAPGAPGRPLRACAHAHGGPRSRPHALQTPTGPGSQAAVPRGSGWVGGSGGQCWRGCVQLGTHGQQGVHAGAARSPKYSLLLSPSKASPAGPRAGGSAHSPEDPHRLRAEAPRGSSPGGRGRQASPVRQAGNVSLRWEEARQGLCCGFRGPSGVGQKPAWGTGPGGRNRAERSRHEDSWGRLETEWLSFRPETPRPAVTRVTSFQVPCVSAPSWLTVSDHSPGSSFCRSGRPAQPQASRGGPTLGPWPAVHSELQPHAHQPVSAPSEWWGTIYAFTF